MNKTFNFYCDENCHLEKDGKPYMLIGYISSAYNQVRLHCDYIRELKAKYGIKRELKWTTISKSAYNFYADVIDYFFSTDLKFRAIVIDKSKLRHEDFNQSHNEFYDKMYYQLLKAKLNSQYKYNIYIDIKDTKSYLKARKLKEIIQRKHSCVDKLQVIRSYESELMQLTDVIMGAISYHLTYKDNTSVIAKKNIIKKLQEHGSLDHSSFLKEEKFNLFFIELQ